MENAKREVTKAGAIAWGKAVVSCVKPCTPKLVTKI